MKLQAGPLWFGLLFINCYQTGGGFNCETVNLSVLVRNSTDWKNKICSKVIYLKKIF